MYVLFYPITLEVRRGTTDEFATTTFHLVIFSAAQVELAKSIPVHSLILSSHLFFCLSRFLFPFTVLCMIVFAKPEDLETWPSHLSLRFLTRSSSYSPMAAWVFLRTSSLVTWSLYGMFNNLRYVTSQKPVFFSLTLTLRKSVCWALPNFECHNKLKFFQKKLQIFSNKYYFKSFNSVLLLSVLNWIKT